MRKPRFALIRFVLLVLGLTLAVPAEDVLETTYDEPETQPYQAIPLLPIASPLTASGMTQAVLNGARLRSDAPFRSDVTTSNDMGQHPNDAIVVLSTPWFGRATSVLGRFPHFIGVEIAPVPMKGPGRLIECNLDQTAAPDDRQTVVHPEWRN